MKKTIVSLMLVLASSAFAGGTGDIGSVGGDKAQINQRALQLLMSKNPIAQASFDSELPGMPVNQLLATEMLSVFNKNGDGKLAVTTIECVAEKKVAVYDCTLSITMSDGVHQVSVEQYEVNGLDALNGNTIVKFKVQGAGAEKLIGSVTYFTAD